jgi:hypothetical protein
MLRKEVPVVHHGPGRKGTICHKMVLKRSYKRMRKTEQLSSSIVSKWGRVWKAMA